MTHIDIGQGDKAKTRWVTISLIALKTLFFVLSVRGKVIFRAVQPSLRFYFFSFLKNDHD